jgi:hypothetical protein
MPHLALDPVLARRDFVLATVLAMIGGATITISGCGSDSSSPSSPSSTPSPTTGDKVGSISANHGHVAVITAARLTTGGAFSLDIAGNAGHSHTVDLTASEMTSVAANQRVSKESTNNQGHSHTVTFN